MWVLDLFASLKKENKDSIKGKSLPRVVTQLYWVVKLRLYGLRVWSEGVRKCRSRRRNVSCRSDTLLSHPVCNSCQALVHVYEVACLLALGHMSPFWQLMQLS